MTGTNRLSQALNGESDWLTEWFECDYMEAQLIHLIEFDDGLPPITIRVSVFFYESDDRELLKHQLSTALEWRHFAALDGDRLYPHEASIIKKKISDRLSKWNVRKDP